MSTKTTIASTTRKTCSFNGVDQFRGGFVHENCHKLEVKNSGLCKKHYNLSTAGRREAIEREAARRNAEIETLRNTTAIAHCSDCKCVVVTNEWSKRTETQICQWC